MNNSFFNWPKLNLKGVPRILRGLLTDYGPNENRTWYDQKGNTVDANPYTQNEIYDAFGKRYVFYRGDWQQDDPTAYKAFNHPLTGVAMSALTSPGAIPGVGGLVSGWGSAYWLGGQVNAKLANGTGNEWQKVQERYSFMTPTGEYINGYDDNGNPNLIQKNTWEWIVSRWGDNPPQDVVDEFMKVYGNSDPNVYDASPFEAMLLDNPDPTAAQLGLDLRQSMEPQYTLVRLPGPKQYAITLPGEGDRWKFVIQKDSEGNWVKVYRRTYGAKKEKEMALRAKGKWKEK